MLIRFISNRMTVPFEELTGSPEEMVTSAWAGSGATRQLKCLSVNRVALVNELLGYNVFYRRSVSIHLPAPFGRDLPALIATSVVVKPFGKVSSVATDARFADYEYSTIAVTYEWNTKIESRKYGLITLRETLQDISDFITLPTKNLYWGTGGSAEKITEGDAPSKINYGLEWTYTITGAHTVPEEIFVPVGKVNFSSISTPGGYAFPLGTLLYAAPIVESEVTYGGTVYRITLRFLQKNNGTVMSPKGWNWYPRISASGSDITYERITDGINSKAFYPTADYRNVFV